MTIRRWIRLYAIPSASAKPQQPPRGRRGLPRAHHFPRRFQPVAGLTTSTGWRERSPSVLRFAHFLTRRGCVLEARPDARPHDGVSPGDDVVWTEINLGCHRARVVRSSTAAEDGAPADSLAETASSHPAVASYLASARNLTRLPGPSGVAIMPLRWRAGERVSAPAA